MIVSPAGVLSDSVHTEMALGGAAAVYWLLVELQGMEQVQLAGELSRHPACCERGREPDNHVQRTCPEVGIRLSRGTAPKGKSECALCLLESSGGGILQAILDLVWNLGPASL